MEVTIIITFIHDLVESCVYISKEKYTALNTFRKSKAHIMLLIS